MKLITDRTYADVLQGTEKGVYGPTDLNRVAQAVAELYAAAEALGIRPPAQIKTDWALPGLFSPETWPTRQQMDDYLRNILHLCRSVALLRGIPQTMENLTWEGANALEEALLLVYPRIENALQIFRYSGEFFAGEEN